MSLLLHSLLKQTIIPDEIFIIDGGSTDKTIDIITAFQKKHRTFPLKLLKKKGNRAVARNYGIRHAKNSILLLSDAGCILSPTWAEEIMKPFHSPYVVAVAGYYKGKASSVFQKSLLPYVLVMPERIKKRTFLPSTRSMAIRKKMWKSLGGFPEMYSHNEDYVFARNLEKKGKKIFFAKKAIVYWLPRKTILSAFIMFFRFAYGDAESGILRPKVALLFLRYLFFICLFFVTYKGAFSGGEKIIVLLTVFYITWAIVKNYKYVRDAKATFYLPLLQITSDIAVIFGTIFGITFLLSQTLVFKAEHRRVLQ